MVPTVERGLLGVVFCSIAITGEEYQSYHVQVVPEFSYKLSYISRKGFHIPTLSLCINGIKGQ